MKRNLFRIGLCVLIASLLVIGGVLIFAAQEGEYTRDISKTGITVTAGDNTISGVYSDPADYWEVANGGSLTDYEIRYDTIYDEDSIIYTAYYPKTTTGRVGSFTEYVCEYNDGSYVVTQVNTSGDGNTYIPVGGFVLSLNSELHPNFAKIGDVVTLGGENKVSTEVIFEGEVPENGAWVDVVGIVSSNHGLSCIKDAKITVLDIGDKKEFAQ